MIFLKQNALEQRRRDGVGQKELFVELEREKLGLDLTVKVIEAISPQIYGSI